MFFLLELQLYFNAACIIQAFLYFEHFDESSDGRNYTYSSKDYVRIMNRYGRLELYSFKFAVKLLAYLESKLPEDKFLQILNYINEIHSDIHENNDFNEEQINNFKKLKLE